MHYTHIMVVSFKNKIYPLFAICLLFLAAVLSISCKSANPEEVFFEKIVHPREYIFDIYELEEYPKLRKDKKTDILSFSVDFTDCVKYDLPQAGDKLTFKNRFKTNKDMPGNLYAYVKMPDQAQQEKKVIASDIVRKTFIDSEVTFEIPQNLETLEFVIEYSEAIKYSTIYFTFEEVTKCTDTKKEQKDLEKAIKKGYILIDKNTGLPLEVGPAPEAEATEGQKPETENNATEASEETTDKEKVPETEEAQELPAETEVKEETPPSEEKQTGEAVPEDNSEKTQENVSEDNNSSEAGNNAENIDKAETLEKEAKTAEQQKIPEEEDIKDTEEQHKEQPVESAMEKENAKIQEELFAEEKAKLKAEQARLDAERAKLEADKAKFQAAAKAKAEAEARKIAEQKEKERREQEHLLQQQKLEETIEAVTNTNVQRYEKEYLNDYAVSGYTFDMEEEKEKSPQLFENPNKADEFGVTLLMEAAKEGNDWKIRALINAGADVNMKDKDGWTALMYAVRYHGNMNCVELLINAGADIKVKNNYGTSVLILASNYNSNPEILKKILEYYSPNEKDVLKSFIQVLTENQDEEYIQMIKVNLFLDLSVPLNSLFNGKTPLMYAAESGKSTKVIEMLLENSNTAIRSREGKTAFDYAKENPKLKHDDIYWSLNNK